MKRVLVVYCHPDPASLIAAARDRALAGLAAAGHEVRVTDLYAEEFEPALSANERRAHKAPVITPELRRHADDLEWAQALVLVYPTWWSGQPAMLKGWFDRMRVSGVAWELPEGANVLRPLLANVRRIIVVTGHGSPKWINAVEGEAGKRTVTRSLRAMCSKRTRTTWCAAYGLDNADAAARERFLARVGRTLSKL